MMEHFTLHKQKYLGFLVIAVLVSVVTYAVRSTEASVYPLTPEQELLVEKNCPARFARFHGPMQFFHPCVRAALFERMFLPLEQPAPSPAVVPVQDASLDATTTVSSTEEAEATTTASSTDTVNLEVSSSTEASSAEEAGTSTVEVVASSTPEEGSSQ